MANGKIAVCGRKKYPRKDFRLYFPNDWKFLNKSLQAFRIFISTQSYNISFNYLQLRQSYAMFKHDRFINFYISLEKKRKTAISLQQYDGFP